LDTLLNLRQDRELIALHQATANIKEELSEYAQSNIAEFIAEAWAEYRNNPSPRPIAQSIAELIRQRYAAKFA